MFCDRHLKEEAYEITINRHKKTVTHQHQPINTKTPVQLDLSKMHTLIATITLLLPIATAQVQADARFYHDSDCKAFAIGCANLPENTCCTVSDGGTVFYNSGSFYNTAAQLGVDINGNMYTLQEGVVNDCGIPACGDM